ncbi:MAG: vitamin K epoxide reductase family protein [Candidatus Spechtbacterales bacterium]
MTNLKPSLMERSQTKISNKWIFTLLFFSFVGFSVSAYLTATFYLGEVPTCTVLKGCEEVTTSQYSKIGPIPTSLLGLGYFLSLLIMLVAYLDMKKEKIFKLFALMTIPGALISLVLLFLQFGVLKAVCVYCLAADISILLITGSTVFLYLAFIKKSKQEEVE